MYTAFASVYDRLMADVDYLAWARFYHELMERYGVPRGKVCECACGTGSITIALSKMGYQMTGVDLSPDMLFEASQKARRTGAMIPFVRQDMRRLHLHRCMDAVLCTNDGLNYLKDASELTDFFRAAFLSVREGGALRMLPPNEDSPEGIWVRAERDGTLTEVTDLASLASHGWAWKYPDRQGSSTLSLIHI